MDKLKGKLVEKRVNYEHCAKALGITKVTFVKKMNKKTQFTLDEIKALSDLLELSDAEKIQIFLP